MLGVKKGTWLEDATAFPEMVHPSALSVVVIHAVGGDTQPKCDGAGRDNGHQPSGCHGRELQELVLARGSRWLFGEIHTQDR